MDIKSLISKDIKMAESILQKEGIEYLIEDIMGYKDQDILCDKCVIRAIEKNSIITLTVTNFKTCI